MVLKRPTQIEGQEPPGEEPDIELMEHLVKKSLDINPGLRQDRSTREFLRGIKKEAVEKSGRGGKRSPDPAKKKASLAQRRRNTIEFFFEQKLEEYGETAEEILKRIQALEAELKESRQSSFEEIVDFLSLIAGSGDSPEAREVMRAYRKFLKELGVSEDDIIRACKER